MKARWNGRGCRLLLFPVALLVILGSSGCASRNAVTTAETHDPFEKFNRVMYRVNDVGDRYLLRPVAVGYTWVLPSPIRTGVRNVFSNLLYPVTIANDFLQGKFRQTGRDGARFLLNSTVGLLGIFDPAKRIGLAENDEDFDQTLGKWSLAEGPYLVLPVFGPRTVRHLFGDIVDSPLTPYLSITNGNLDLTRLGVWVLHQVDNRSHLLDVDQQVFEAFDPYLFVRDTYLQNRRYKAADGNLPEAPDDAYPDEAAPDHATPDEAKPDDAAPEDPVGK